MRVLLTGGLGFIGSHVAEKLIDAGIEVMIIDDGSSGDLTSRPTVCRTIVACITSRKALDAITMFKPHCIVHLAAQVNVTTSVQEPLRDLHTNVMGTVSLLALAQRIGVQRFVFASSGGAVYGDQPLRPTPEVARVAPLSPYGLSKLSAETYLNWFSEQGALRCVNLRFSNVYGPRQGIRGEGGVIGIFAREIVAGRALVCFGDGQQTRDFVYVDCVARAVLKSVFQHDLPGTINIASGVEIKIEEVAQIMTRIAGVEPCMKFKAAKSNEVRHSCLDNSLARVSLEWSPACSFEQGCEAVLKWAWDHAHSNSQSSASFTALKSQWDLIQDEATCEAQSVAAYR